MRGSTVQRAISARKTPVDKVRKLILLRNSEGLGTRVRAIGFLSRVLHLGSAGARTLELSTKGLYKRLVHGVTNPSELRPM